MIMERLDTYIHLASQDDDGGIGDNGFGDGAVIPELNGHLSDLRSIDCGTDVRYCFFFLTLLSEYSREYIATSRPRTHGAPFRSTIS